MDKPLILIVDDEPVNQFLLEGLLGENGYDTITASDGFKCIEILGSKTPDLILLDIMMPKMSGIEVLGKIMENETWRLVPVIMVTAKSTIEDVKESLDMGAIDYIKKPFNEVELLARIKVGVRLSLYQNNLREMVAVRNDFVKIISHDLRSPFTAINGFAAMMMKDKSLSEKHKQFLTLILDSVEFSNDYFNKLLKWTMSNQYRIELVRSEINIFQLCEKVLDIFQKKAIEKNIKLVNEVVTSSIVNIDESLFRQVINNLVNNAIKFTPQGGYVKCSTEKNELLISDNGVGMPDDITPETFFKTEILKSNRGTEGEKGTGVGLVICYKILTAHGFEFTFDRNPTGGTRFIIRFS